MYFIAYYMVYKINIHEKYKILFETRDRRENTT